MFFSESQTSPIVSFQVPFVPKETIYTEPWSKIQINNKINNNSYSILENSISYNEPKNTSFNFIFNWLSKKLNTFQLKNLRISFITCSLLWFVLTLLIFFRITKSNHFPLANFYEALIFLTWCLVTLNFIILLEPTGKTKSVISTGSKKQVLSFLQFPQITTFYEEQSVQKQVSGAILAPCILVRVGQAYLKINDC